MPTSAFEKAGIFTGIVQRQRQWFNNRGKQTKSVSVSPVKGKRANKALVKRRPLLVWQAFAVLFADEVKERVDPIYTDYLAQAPQGAGVKVTSRLTFVRVISTEMFEESDPAKQEYVRKRMKEDAFNMPENLIEAQETIGEEEVKRYLKNYRRQRSVCLKWRARAPLTERASTVHRRACRRSCKRCLGD